MAISYGMKGIHKRDEVFRAPFDMDGALHICDIMLRFTSDALHGRIGRRWSTTPSDYSDTFQDMACFRPWRVSGYITSGTLLGFRSFDSMTGTLTVYTRKGRHTEMRLGRWLLACGWRADEANELANYIKAKTGALADAKLSICQSEAEIVKVYEKGPDSCMSGSAYTFHTDGEHPAIAYDSPDIHVAYAVVDGRIIARAVCNAQESTYSTVYGNKSLMGTLLGEAGYSRDEYALDGCRLRAIPHVDDGTYVGPYVDNVEKCGLSADGQWLILGQGNLDCQSTDGIIGDRTCESCHESVGNNTTFVPDVGGVCEYCLEESYVWVDDRYIHIDEAVYAEYYDEYLLAVRAVWCEPVNSYVHEFDLEDILSEFGEDDDDWL